MEVRELCCVQQVLQTTSTQISVEATDNTLCHLLSDSSVPPLVVFSTLPLIPPSPLLFTCSINSSGCLSSTTSISLWSFSLGKPGRPGQQYSLLFTPLPWENLSHTGPEHPPPSIMQQTWCLGGMFKARVPCFRLGAPAKIRYEGLFQRVLASVNWIISTPLQQRGRHSTAHSLWTHHVI